MTPETVQCKHQNIQIENYKHANKPTKQIGIYVPSTATAKLSPRAQRRYHHGIQSFRWSEIHLGREFRLVGDLFVNRMRPVRSTIVCGLPYWRLVKFSLNFRHLFAKRWRLNVNGNHLAVEWPVEVLISILRYLPHHRVCQPTFNWMEFIGKPSGWVIHTVEFHSWWFANGESPVMVQLWGAISSLSSPESFIKSLNIRLM